MTIILCKAYEQISLNMLKAVLQTSEVYRKTINHQLNLYQTKQQCHLNAKCVVSEMQCLSRVQNYTLTPFIYRFPPQKQFEVHNQKHKHTQIMNAIFN